MTKKTAVHVGLVKNFFCTAAMHGETFFHSGSQWEIYKKSTKIRRIHGTVRAGKIRCMLVSCAYCAPEVVSRRTKYCVPEIFISSCLCYKFIYSTVTDKQKATLNMISVHLCFSRFRKYIY